MGQAVERRRPDDEPANVWGALTPARLAALIFAVSLVAALLTAA